MPDMTKQKSMLAFTSSKVLKLFTKSTKESLDGIFKSSCRQWKQQFIFMLKVCKHWIPILWGWLRDKTDAFYGVSGVLFEDMDRAFKDVLNA